MARKEKSRGKRGLLASGVGLLARAAMVCQRGSFFLFLSSSSAFGSEGKAKIVCSQLCGHRDWGDQLEVVAERTLKTCRR